MNQSIPLNQIINLIQNCSQQEINYLYEKLRITSTPHPYEVEVGASAIVILDAIHRSPELTKRMLRGILAEAAFGNYVIPFIQQYGWINVTPQGNFAYDYALGDARGTLKVQVKLQRSEKGQPSIIEGKSPYYINKPTYKVETQKTRGGKDSEDESTRYYRYGEFDIIAVSLQPSTGNWNTFMYSLGRWLNKSTKYHNCIEPNQPVPFTKDLYWTDNFLEAADWYYSGRPGWNGY